LPVLSGAVAREGSPRASRAWPLAWPSPSGPLGRQRSTALKGGSRRSFLRSGQKRSPGALDAGGADPDNARRSDPGAVTFSRRQAHRRDTDGLAAVLAGAAAGYGGDRRRPVTGAAVRGSRRAVGLASEGPSESCRPATARPRVNLGRLWRVTLAAHSSRLLAPGRAVHGGGRQARRAEGAPLKPYRKLSQGTDTRRVLFRLMLDTLAPFDA
jgi:hypothetical protein